MSETFKIKQDKWSTFSINLLEEGEMELELWSHCEGFPTNINELMIFTFNLLEESDRNSLEYLIELIQENLTKWK